MKIEVKPYDGKFKYEVISGVLTFDRTNRFRGNNLEKLLRVVALEDLKMLAQADKKEIFFSNLYLVNGHKFCVSAYDLFEQTHDGASVYAAMKEDGLWIDVE